jgi:hypothetical protein
MNIMWDVGYYAGFLGLAKFTTLIPLSLQILCKFSFRNICWKMSFLRTFALKYPNTFQFFVEAAHHVIDFILCWSMNVQNNDIKPATS